MNKRHSLFVVIAIATLILIPSCNPLYDFIWHGNNVMGDYVNTESANEVSSIATNAETENATETVTVNNASNLQETGNEVTIKVGSSETKTEVKLFLSRDDAKKLSEVTTVLSAMDDDTKDKLVSAVSAASTNDASKENLVSTLKQTASEEQKEAAKGTATVVSVLLKQVSDTSSDSSTSGSSSDSSATSTVREVLKKVSESMDEIAKKNDVTNGDVVALQLMTRLAEKVTEKAVDSNGSIKSDLSATDFTDLASDALETATTINAISEASTIDIGDISSLISAFTNTSSTSSSSSTSTSSQSRDVSTRGTEVDSNVMKSLQVIYANYKSIFPNGISGGKEINTLSMYKSSVDLYLKFVGENDNAVSEKISNVNSIIQYTVVSIFITLNENYSSVANAVFSGSYPTSVDDFIAAFVEENPAIADSTISSSELKMPDGITFKDNCDYKTLLGKLLPSFKTTACSIKKIAYNLNLDEFGDIKKYINGLPAYCVNDNYDSFNWDDYNN